MFSIEMMRRLHRKIMEKVSDPYREVLITERWQPYQGASTYMGYTDPKPSREIKNVVPITTPELYIQGLDWLIFSTEHNSTKPHTLRPSGLGWNEFVPGELKERQKKYLHDLEAMYKKYSDLHPDILKKMKKKERTVIATKLAEAKKYTVKFSEPYNPDPGGEINDNMIEDGLPLP